MEMESIFEMATGSGKREIDADAKDARNKYVTRVIISFLNHYCQWRKEQFLGRSQGGLIATLYETLEVKGDNQSSDANHFPIGVPYYAVELLDKSKFWNMIIRKILCYREMTKD